MPKKALIVDNDFFFVEFLAERLESSGYQITKAYESIAAISNLEKEVFDLIFVDLIMPKIDGRQVIGFARSKYPNATFTLVALPILEQIDCLHDIAADYFITKAPVEKMAEHIDLLLAKLERGALSSFPAEKLFQSNDLIPRQITDDLVQAMNFQQAVTEGMGIGLMVLDEDTKIINCNPLALDIVGRPIHEILNRSVISLLSNEDREEFVGALKKVLYQTRLKTARQKVLLNSKEIGIIISLLKVNGTSSGWIIAMISDP